MPRVNSPKMPDLASALGSRVTIRLHEKSGGYRDIVGILKSEGQIVNSKGQSISFDTEDIAIWRQIKPLPDRAGTGAPLSLRISELENISNTTWQADREVLYGKWIARLSQGYTLRANSVLPTGTAPFGEPPEQLETSIAHIKELYDKSGLTPAFVIPLPIYSELDSYLAKQGWSQKLIAHYLVNECMTEKPEPIQGFTFFSDSKPDDQWLAVQGDENLLPIMCRTPALYGRIEHEGQLVGVGRIAVVGSWSIVTRLFIAPEFRGRGLSKFLMNNLTYSGYLKGASKIFLQVDGENSVALSLYKSMGFREHHSCSFRELLNTGAL